MPETLTRNFNAESQQPDQQNRDAQNIQNEIIRLNIEIDSEKRRLEDLKSDYNNARSGKGEYEVEIERSRYRISQLEKDLEKLNSKSHSPIENITSI